VDKVENSDLCGFPILHAIQWVVIYHRKEYIRQWRDMCGVTENGLFIDRAYFIL
jgi:ribose 5-phosphate isomerase